LKLDKKTLQSRNRRKKKKILVTFEKRFVIDEGMSRAPSPSVRRKLRSHSSYTRYDIRCDLVAYVFPFYRQAFAVSTRCSGDDAAPDRTDTRVRDVPFYTRKRSPIGRRLVQLFQICRLILHMSRPIGGLAWIDAVNVTTTSARQRPAAAVLQYAVSPKSHFLFLSLSLSPSKRSRLGCVFCNVYFTFSNEPSSYCTWPSLQCTFVIADKRPPHARDLLSPIRVIVYVFFFSTLLTFCNYFRFFDKKICTQRWTHAFRNVQSHQRLLRVSTVRIYRRNRNNIVYERHLLVAHLYISKRA